MSSKAPVRVGGVFAACHRPLEALEIQDTASNSTSTIPSPDSLLKSCIWHPLRFIKVASISTDALARIGTFPSLTTLYISNLPAAPDETVGNLFPALQTAILLSSDIQHFASFLQCMPPDNQIRTLKFTLTSYDEDKKPGDVIQAVANHCNLQTLREFVLEETTTILEVEEPVDVNPTSNLDTSPLFPFGELKTVSINLTHEVYLKSSDIKAISRNWPHLTTLNVDTEYPNSRVPIIDHADVLTLI